MSKEDGVSPTPNSPAEDPSPKGDAKKALIFVVGAIAFILALKFILGY